MPNKPPRKGKLSSYTTGRINKRSNVITNVNQNTINDRSTGTPGTKNFVQRSPIENIGTPGTKNFVQRSPLENTGTPGTKNFVRRDFTRSPVKNSKPPAGPTR